MLITVCSCVDSLHFAISSQREEVCRYLVQHRADVRICRYVPLQLMNEVTLRGTIVSTPDSNAVCKVMPSLQNRHLLDTRAGPSVSDATSKLDSWITSIAKGGHAPVAPEEASPAREPQQETAYADNGCFRVEALLSSPLFRSRNARDVIFFRTAPGSSLLKPNLLCVLLIGEHVTQVEMMKARKLHQKGKLFHLLIRNFPDIAVLAMDSFRTPLFRCSTQKHIREYNQQWTIDAKLNNPQERQAALFLQMKGDASRRNRRRRPRAGEARIWHLLWKPLRKLWKFVRRVKSFLSVQNVFASSEANSAQHRQSIVCEPKGVLYEYIFDHAEYRGGFSPTLSAILKVRTHRNSL